MKTFSQIKAESIWGRKILYKSRLISQQSLVRSRKQRRVMRPNNETMLAWHTQHSTHCLKRLNSLNCLIKSVKTLQTAIKLTIVFPLCSRKLSNLVSPDESLTLNIAIIYCSLTARRFSSGLCSLVVNICHNFLFIFVRVHCLCSLDKLCIETHSVDSSCQQTSMDCII